MKKNQFRYWAAALVALLALVGLGSAASAAFPPTQPSSLNAPNQPVKPTDDGFDRLPTGLKAVSYSTLVNMGLVHPSTRPGGPAKADPIYNNPPALNIVWGPPVNVSNNSGGPYGANEPGTSMHTIDPLKGVSGGNSYNPSPVHANVERTTDQGATFLRQPSTNISSDGDGVPIWIPNVNSGNDILFTALNASGVPQVSASLSTDSGTTYANLGNTPAIPNQFNDREYLWRDRNPASPNYGRVYITFTEFDSGGSGSFDSIVVRYTTNQGTTWSTPVSLVDPLALNSQGLSQFGSLATLPNGHAVAMWRQGTFNNTNTTKFKWSRSTDGGATFPISGTIATIPVNQSISFNTNSPGGFRWGDAPDIGADPTNGDLYASWISLRTPSNTSSAATYVSRSTDEGNTWSTPVVVDNSQPTRYQYFPWVNVSKDHTVHVTYGAQASASASNVAQFYSQSTDGGLTWSAPFMLSGSAYTTTAFMGDYQGMDIGADTGGSGVIFATWTDTSVGENRFGRFGSFVVGTPTPTATGGGGGTATVTPPPGTATRTSTAVSGTSTSTPIATATVCTGGSGTPGPFVVASPAPTDFYGSAVTNNGTYAYSGGGYSFSGGGVINLFARYDPVANAWATLSPMPDANSDASAVYSPINNKIYVFGGGDASFNPTALTRIYDVAAGTWSAGPAMPDVRAFFAAAVYNTANNKIYLVAGYNTGQVTSAQTQVWEFDPVAGTFNSTRMPIPHAVGGSGYGIYNGHIYVAGGRDASNTVIALTFDYNIAADTWTAKANELAADNVPGSSIVNGKLWVYGGGNPFSGNAKKSTSAFNAPATTGATQIYDPGTDTWTNGPSLNVARSFVGGTTVGNYTVAVGGYTGSSTTATTEVSNNPGSPCVTASPTSPAGTATATSSPGSSATATTQATATATACTGSGNYTVTTGTGVLVPATNDIGNACDDCSTSIILPFPVQLYDQTYTAANIGSNGYIAFGTDAPNYTDITCLPGPTGTYLIAPYWTDQDTDPLDGCTDCGIFTSTTGIAPNRTFNVEFRNIYYAETGAHDLDYEVQLHEGQSTYNVVYGLITPASVANDSPLTVGVQKDNTLFTEVGCDPSGGQAPPVSTGQMLTFSLPSCVTGTPTAPPANTATATTQPANTATATTQPVNSPTATTQPVNSPTATTQPAASPTATTRPFATATPTPCSINFSDVHMSDYFYVPVQYLYCHGVISGYSDGTFRPYNNTTRSQMVKIVVLGFNKAIVTPTGGAYTFTDVTPANPFFSVVETAAADGIVSGYNCGVAPAGPCDSQNRPYFLPYNYVTRGQLSKIDVIAAGWALYNPPVGHFIDVIPGSVFYTVIETAYCHGVISGYSDRTFRPYNNAIRGQIAKIVYLSIVNPPVTCGP